MLNSAISKVDTTYNTTQEDQIVAYHECERLIALYLTKMIEFEQKTLDSDTRAFGMSLSSSLAFGLMYPQTDEARTAIEKYYKSISYSSEGLENCLSTFGKVPQNSALPHLMLKDILRAEPVIDPSEYDVGEAMLEFYQNCTSDFIKNHLFPLASTHKNEIIAKRIRNICYRLAPELIPIDQTLKKITAAVNKGKGGFNKRSQPLFH